MVKKSLKNPIPPERLAEYDTGIFRTPPMKFYPLTSWKDWDAFSRREKKIDEKLFNLDWWFAKIEKLSHRNRARYEGPGGYPLPRSKAKGIPHNVKRVVDYAQVLWAYQQHLRQAVEKGDVRQVALYGILVGYHYLALDICESRAEEFALSGRKNEKHLRNLHDGLLEKGARARAKSIAEAEKIWTATPKLRRNSVAKLVAERTGQGFEAVRKHLKGISF